MPKKLKRAAPKTEEKSDPRRQTRTKVLEYFEKYPEESAYEIGMRAGISDKRVHQIASELGWGQVKTWRRL